MSNWMLWPWVHFEALTPDGAAAQAGISADTLKDESGAIEVTPDRCGNFTLEDVYPGSCRIFSLPAPAPYFMAAVSGSYDALAFAEPGGVPQLDDILISQAGKVTVHADETA